MNQCWWPAERYEPNAVGHTPARSVAPAQHAKGQRRVDQAGAPRARAGRFRLGARIESEIMSDEDGCLREIT